MDGLDRESCYRALCSRDTRFDGRLFVGVTSTGVYCRPVCPARTPRIAHCRFFPSAAAAQTAGFRPCLRCRPETAPEGGAWRGTASTVARALSLISDGALDDSAAGVDQLADRLGIGGRQLRRLFQQHLGASPIAVAQTRRVLFAKQLLQETRLPMTEVALAAGFGSLRRFNECFRALFGRPPRSLRRGTTTSLRAGAAGHAGVTVRVRYRPPYDWEAMLGHLAARAIVGVEHVAAGVYQRTVTGGDGVGTIDVTHEPARQNLVVTVRFPDVRAIPLILASVRRVFDVGADLDAIDTHLSRDPAMAALVAERPGLRAPGGWDGLELAVRAVLGQQITVAAAQRLAGRLVALCGTPLPSPVRMLTHAFPSAEQLARADLRMLGMPAARRATLIALARAALADPRLFHPAASVEAAIARLREIPGVGEWTAQYIALRALREPDAFPASDVGLLRGAAAHLGVRPTPADLLRRAEAWRPWRAYGAQHLWAADVAGDRQPREVRHG